MGTREKSQIGLSYIWKVFPNNSFSQMKTGGYGTRMFAVQNRNEQDNGSNLAYISITVI